MSPRVSASLNLTVPLILLIFAAILSAVNLLHHVPRAERAAEDEVRKRLSQEMSRLQSTLEYLLLKGDAAVAQHEIAVLAHNHDLVFVALTDDRRAVIAATRRAWLGRSLEEVMPQFDSAQAAGAIRERRARLTVDAHRSMLLGYAGILMGSEGEELRPSRSGSLLVAHDLSRPKAEARARVLEQSLLWAGWVIALALVLWLVFYFLLTRGTARLVRVAEQLAAGDLAVRSDLRGQDELGRLGRAFDAMARNIAETQTRLQDDILAQAAVQRSLERSEASYRAIFDATEDAVFVLDIEHGAVIDANPKACAMYGHTREELLEVDPSRLRFGESRSQQNTSRERFARARAGEPQHFEWHLQHRDGSMHWEEVFMKRVNLGDHDRILTLIRDVTEKKQVAEELSHQREALYQREKLAALGSLLAGVSHELNNPLSVVVARAVLLEEQGDSATRAAAAKIRTAAERCARIVRSFLSMARQQPPERRAVAVNDVAADALDIAAYAVRNSGIEVAVDLARGVPLVRADADQIHQVLLNLIINAQQSLQDHPAPRRIKLTSRFHVASNQILITVADNGPGIPAELRARVFEPYFTTKPSGIGTGVGLAVSVGIVEAHGGTLTVDCPLEGGAVFTIALPVGALEPLQPEATDSGPAIAARRTILVVDDEAEVRDTLTAILTGAEHRVVTASSGHEALERMAVESFDVILTDIRMPDLDGRGLYQELERRWPDEAGRVVFVTGDTLTSSLREFVLASGRVVIEKPFLPAEVRRVVAEMVTRASEP